MVARPIDIAVIGAGGISVTHISALRRDPRAHIRAIVDVEETRAQSRAQELGNGVGAFKSVNAMLEHIHPHALVICTPPAFHADAVVTGLRAGISVLCEKPIAHKKSDALRIVHAVEKSTGVFLMGFCHRYVDGVRRLKELIDSGELGRPILFRTHFSARIEGVEATWFSRPKLSGGGVLMDTSILSIDLFRHLIGEPTQAVSTLATNIKGIDVEDTSVLILKSKNGCLGCIESSWIPPVGAKVIEIRGTEGAAIWDYETLRWRREDDETWTEERLGKPYQSRFDHQAHHFLDLVEGKSRPRVTAEDGRRALDIALMAYRSAQRKSHN